MTEQTKMAFDIALELARTEGIMLFGFQVDPKTKVLSAFSNQNDSLDDIVYNASTACQNLMTARAEFKQRNIYHA